MVHRAIWYNFTYHVERDIPMSEPLTTWAMNISQPSLEYHDVTYLDVSTLKYPTGVDSTVKNDQHKSLNEQEWIPVTGKRRLSNKKSTATSDQASKTGGILQQPKQNTRKNPRKLQGSQNQPKHRQKCSVACRK